MPKLVLTGMILLASWGDVFAKQSLFSNSDHLFRPIVSVGDVHGNLPGLQKILRDHHFTNSHQDYVGTDQILVLHGDMTSKGKQNVETIDYSMELRKQALRLGGEIDFIRGNHDMDFIYGEFPEWSQSDLEAAGISSTDPEEIYRSIRERYSIQNPEFTEWALACRAVLKIGKILFSHAGPSPQMAHFSADEINQYDRELAYDGLNRNLDQRPSRDSMKTMRQRSSYLRGNIIDDPELSLVTIPHSEKYRRTKLMDQALANQDASLMVVGHRTVKIGEEMFFHPFFGDRLIRTDTGNHRGKLTSVLFTEHDVRLIDHRLLDPLAHPIAIRSIEEWLKEVSPRSRNTEKVLFDEKERQASSFSTEPGRCSLL